MKQLALPRPDFHAIAVLDPSHVNGQRYFLRDFGMQAVDFFRSRIGAMINMNDPMAVLASRLPGASHTFVC